MLPEIMVNTRVCLLFFWGAMVSVTGNAVGVEIVAHRGASEDAPENTLAAINLGWDQQADAVEFDVWLSADGEIVLHHDADTKRTAGVDQRIDQQTTSQLRALDVGTWKSPRFAGEKIPLLREALATIPEGKRVFIEVKCGPEIVPVLKQQLAQAARPAAQTAIISFSQAVCAECVNQIPEVKVYWLSAFKEDPETKTWTPTLPMLIETARRLKVHGLDLQARDFIDASFVEAVRSRNLEFYVWTVNDDRAAIRLKEAGVQGITTDRPGLMRERLTRPR